MAPAQRDVFGRIARVARIQSRALADAVAVRLPERTRQARHGRFSFRYPSRSLVGRAVAGGTTWDAYLLDVVRDLPAGALVCEVGSNIGASLLTMAATRDDLRFVCFEPSDRFLPYLRENVERNGLGERVTIVPALVGAGDRAWHLTSNTSTASVVSGRYDGHIPVEEQTLRPTSLDAYFAARGEGPAFLKVDTDGFEVEVLRSASELLATARPIVSFEYAPRLVERLGQDPEELRRLLLDAGYVTAEVHRPDGSLVRADHPLSEPLSTDTFLDVIVRFDRR